MMETIIRAWTSVPGIKSSCCEILNHPKIKFILHRRVEESAVGLEWKVTPIYTGLPLRVMKARLGKGSDLQSGWSAECCVQLQCGCFSYWLTVRGFRRASSTLSLSGHWRFCKTEPPTFTGQGQQSQTLQGLSSQQDPGQASVAAQKPWEEPLRGLCAFPSPFPGAAGVLTWWVRCPVFRQQLFLWEECSG